MAATETQQHHCEVFAVRPELAVALDDLHLAAVHQAGSTGCHPSPADCLGYLGTAFDRGEDLRVKPVDLATQVVDVVQWLGSDGLLDGHRGLPIPLSCGFFWFADHSFSGLTQETSPGSGSGPRGSELQLRGYRRPVPVEKSPRVEHGSSVPSTGHAPQRNGQRNVTGRR